MSRIVVNPLEVAQLAELTFFIRKRDQHTQKESSLASTDVVAIRSYVIG
ncbi:hypothetical protein [Bartonella sp. CB178]